MKKGRLLMEMAHMDRPLDGMNPRISENAIWPGAFFHPKIQRHSVVLLSRNARVHRIGLNQFPSSSSITIRPTSILLIYLTTRCRYLAPFREIRMLPLRRPSASCVNDEPPTLDMRCNQSCPSKHLYTHSSRTLIYYLCEEHEIKNSQDLFSKVVMSGISYTLNFHQITGYTGWTYLLMIDG